MILADSNVLLDLIKDDPIWAQWSLATLDAATLNGPVLINSVIYAELSVGYPSIDALEKFIEGTGVRMVEIPKEALFLAGKAFIQYRRSGGSRAAILPDFFIGAHASALGTPVITRDVRRYRTYFPDVPLVSPANAD